MYVPLFSLSGRNVAPNNSAKITPPRDNEPQARGKR